MAGMKKSCNWWSMSSVTVEWASKIYTVHFVERSSKFVRKLKTFKVKERWIFVKYLKTQHILADVVDIEFHYLIKTAVFSHFEMQK